MQLLHHLSRQDLQLGVSDDGFTTSRYKDSFNMGKAFKGKSNLVALRYHTLLGVVFRRCVVYVVYNLCLMT